MGLDMYICGRNFFWHAEPWAERPEDRLRGKTVEIDLAYWRKHPNLHGYIVQTYADGLDECQEIELGVDQLRDVIAAVKENRVPHTTEDYFGESEGSAEETDDDVKQLTAALAWLEDGAGDLELAPISLGADFVKPKASRAVYYQASW